MTTTFTSYRQISADLTTSLKRVTEKPDVARETKYYLAHIGNVKTIDDLFADTRLYDYAMKAHGLEDMGYAKAFMRKVLTEGVASDDAFANKLSDSRYIDLVKSLNFAADGPAATASDKARKGVTDKYARQTLEQDAGADNAGVRLALYFERMAPGVTNAYGLLADEALAQVVRTIMQVPEAFAAADIDKQADAVSKAIDLKDLKDPQKMSKLMERFTALWELDNATSSYDPLALFGKQSGFGISSDLLLSINTLKLGGR
ncbi:DUF1217 domain-containing protein [Rhizobium sp. Leaf341]|uniref:DUF1217 domain-containing protein n=1 Tax=Rhizobium sp. Leaf341 TaxID=1736344 RepID=UPI00071537C7|nr:DUF1217 domain-containing protein [Rhizobium sp. Leaf341]KQR77752.1 flagellar biosynthesis protein FlgF [Rhizobium sp. Leaf341]